MPEHSGETLQETIVNNFAFLRIAINRDIVVNGESQIGSLPVSCPFI
jgi:hypothetical protein